MIIETVLHARFANVVCSMLVLGQVVSPGDLEGRSGVTGVLLHARFACGFQPNTKSYLVAGAEALGHSCIMFLM